MEPALTDDVLWAWVARYARCADSGLGPDEWFPVSIDAARARHEAAAAIAVCTGCPVRAQCLELSLRHWDVGQHGVWGGLIAADRARLRRQRPAGHRIGNDRAATVSPGAGELGERQRRSVSAEARRQAPATRGHLRIYLGCAPGAGTTCALLGEGRQRAGHGTDVVVASVETHGRPGTEALLAGLEVISPPTAAERATAGAGIDLGAILARSPQVALVDDLARSNAPTARHAARWQDAEDLLAAGIDVISTVSIAHLESLSDVVAKITGAAPRPPVPH